MKIIFTFFFLILFSSFSSLAQDFISTTQDFSTLNVAELSVEQIEKIKFESKRRNINLKDLQVYLNSKGMSQKQYEELSLRLEAYKKEDSFDEYLNETNKQKPEKVI